MQASTPVPRPEKNIKCDLCSYRCSLKKSLEEHMRIVHLKLNFTCNKCEFACISAHGLNEHRKSFHKEHWSTAESSYHKEVPSGQGYSIDVGKWFKGKRKCSDCDYSSDYQARIPCSKAREWDSWTFIQLCMWFLHDGTGLTLCCLAHGELAWLLLEPDTVLDHCPRILLSCFRARNSVPGHEETQGGFARFDDGPSFSVRVGEVSGLQLPHVRQELPGRSQGQVPPGKVCNSSQIL